MKRTMRAGMIRSVSMVVAPLIILLFGVNAFSWSTSFLRSEESIRSALKIQAFSINDMLSETEKSVKNIISNNLQDILTIQKALPDLNDYLSKQEILNQMKSHTAATDTEDALFLYYPSGGYLLMNSPEIVGLQRVELCGYIPGIFANEEFIKTSWHLREINGNIYAFMWRRVNESYVGGIIPMNEPVKTVMNESEDILNNSSLFFTGEDICVTVSSDGNAALAESGPNESFSFYQRIGGSDISICFSYKNLHMLSFVGAPMLAALLFSVLILLCMPILIGRISSSFTRPFHDIQQGMRLVQQGDFKTQIEGSFPYRETEDMRRAFNEMVSQIRILKNDVYEEKLLRQKTESNFYQLQVKPHFYLNSLNQIHILAQMGDVEGISQAVLQLIEYFRYLLRSNEQTVMLQDEVKHIENFFLIQKRKYPAGFEARVDMPSEMMRLQIPPLFLLTFVENSIKYATGVYDKLELLLRGEKLGENGYRLILEDSGPGFDEKVLEALQEGERLEAMDGHICIGIANARQRLRFVYGEAAYVYFSNGGELPGAHIEILIPNVKGEKKS